MDFLTTDLCDEYSDTLQVATPMFQSYGGHTRFCGEIQTVKVFEDNSLVREALAQPGHGKVLVVDGGGSLRCALVGDQIGELAVKNGWAGIIVYGCIRDSVAINALPIGVRALNTHPLKSVKKGAGDHQLVLTFAGVTFRPGQIVYVDEDGVIVSPKPLL
ncbi:ribonuclease E activity regulator RraA [Aquaspirillum serpens]|uniref:ribonuclease E activity regulator RraA n=1 Tax=Aquaspirillum serpens TaxID=190 RepID=UPI0003B72389|nr:ribonuclease E activity regulator RraA [Aquaspirillum serpens]